MNNEITEPRYDLMHEVAAMLADCDADNKTLLRKIMKLTPDEIILLSAIIRLATAINEEVKRYGINSAEL